MRAIKNIILKSKKSKRLLTESAIIITLCSLISTLCFSSVSALSAQEEVDVQFTFVPSLSISLSSGLIHIDNLTPGNYANSNTIRINVITNNTFGYTLTATVGDEDGTASNELVNGDSEAVFSSLASSDQLTLNNFDPNYWGYTTATSISGSSLYSGLTYGANTTINKTMNPSGRAFGEYLGTNTTSFTIGAMASNDQFSGEYTNVIGFEAIANVDTDVYTYMQDVTKAQLATLLPNTGDNIILTDKRDYNEYQVTNIDGSYWMTQNLRIIGTVTAELSNFTGASFNISADSLTFGNDYITPRATYHNNEAYGVHYNYVAATAGTIIGSSNTEEASHDICPSGWRLPTRDEQSSIIDYIDYYVPVYSGSYYQRKLYNTERYGYWWSSSAKSDSNRYFLIYNNARLSIGENDRAAYGFSIRCVKADDPSMQTMDSTKLAALLPNVGDTTTLPDPRDGTTYTIGKLADGKYWMLDNLALDLTDDTILSAMTSDNTNASDATLAYLKGASTGTTSDQYATAKVANWTSSYSYSAPLVNMDSVDKVPSDATSTAGGWKIGGYYNYCAASAGSYCYGNGTSAGTSSGNATEDICPKGWRMPTGGSSGEYQALYMAYSSNYANFRAALHLPLSGYFSSGSGNYQGVSGYWGSSTRYNNYNYIMYDLYANTSDINPRDYDNRSGGYALRCVMGS